MDSGEATSGPWPWFDAMHEALGERPPILPPTLSASSLVPNHGQTAAKASSLSCEEPSQMSLLPGTESELESMPSNCSQPPTKRPKRGQGHVGSPQKAGCKGGSKRCFSISHSQNEQFLDLFSELLKKTMKKETCMESCRVNWNKSNAKLFSCWINRIVLSYTLLQSTNKTPSPPWPLQSSLPNSMYCVSPFLPPLIGWPAAIDVRSSVFTSVMSNTWNFCCTCNKMLCSLLWCTVKFSEHWGVPCE